MHRDSSNGFGCWIRKFVLVTLVIKGFRIMAVKRKRMFRGRHNVLLVYIEYIAEMKFVYA